MQLLAKGFPERYAAFWERAFEHLSARDTPAGLPRYGHLLEASGRVVGVLLTLHARVGTGPDSRIRCNLSSWYVEPDHRGFAPLLVARATRPKGVTFVNTSPAPPTRPIIEAQGFRTYARGMFVTVPLFALRGSCATILPGTVEPPGRTDPAERALLADHADLGCLTAWGCLDGEAHPFVFAWRDPIGRLLPCGHLVYARGVHDLVRFARPLGRFLLRHGMLAVTVDANGPVRGLPGIFRTRGPKYFKGGDPPRLGDLAYMEAALLGNLRRRGGP